MNVLLTPESALKAGPVKPMYPRRHAPLDARRKADVLKLAFSSMRSLPITKMILNIEATGAYGAELEGVLAHARACFPQAEILQEPSRPTQLEAHRKSIRTAERFFGADLPVICCYNHDHIFVDYRTEPFVRLVQECFGEGRNAESFLIYSHAPEVISSVHDWSAPYIRSACFFGSANPPLDFKRLSLTTWGYKTPGGMCVDSIFVTTCKGLKRLWSAVLPRTDYTPRVDWAGVKFDATKFEVLVSPREFFRHFDGYGHVTALCGGYALGLDGFGPQCQRPAALKPAVFGGARGAMAGGSLAALAQGYAALFFELVAIAARDSWYVALAQNKHGSTGMRMLEELFSLFAGAYLDDPGELEELSAEERQDLRTLVLHKVFSHAAAFQNEVLADCHLYGVLMVNQALSRQTKSA